MIGMAAIFFAYTTATAPNSTAALIGVLTNGFGDGATTQLSLLDARGTPHQIAQLPRQTFGGVIPGCFAQLPSQHAVMICSLMDDGSEQLSLTSTVDGSIVQKWNFKNLRSIRRGA